METKNTTPTAGIDPAEAIERVCDARHERIMAARVAEGMSRSDAELFAASRIVVYLDHVGRAWIFSPRMTSMIAAMRNAYAYELPNLAPAQADPIPCPGDPRVTGDGFADYPHPPCNSCGLLTICATCDVCPTCSPTGHGTAMRNAYAYELPNLAPAQADPIPCPGCPVHDGANRDADCDCSECPHCERWLLCATCDVCPTCSPTGHGTFEFAGVMS